MNIFSSTFCCKCQNSMVYRNNRPWIITLFESWCFGILKSVFGFNLFKVELQMPNLSVWWQMAGQGPAFWDSFGIDLTIACSNLERQVRFIFSIHRYALISNQIKTSQRLSALCQAESFTIDDKREREREKNMKIKSGPLTTCTSKLILERLEGAQVW